MSSSRLLQQPRTRSIVMLFMLVTMLLSFGALSITIAPTTSVASADEDASPDYVVAEQVQVVPDVGPGQQSALAPITCTTTLHYPHHSGHLAGRVNVVADTTCNGVLAAGSTEATLKRNGVVVASGTPGKCAQGGGAFFTCKVNEECRSGAVYVANARFYPVPPPGYKVLASTPAQTTRQVFCDQINGGNSILPGEEMRTRTGNNRLIMQGDGNLVLYVNNVARWSSCTNNKPGARAVMQGDGNLVVYHGNVAVYQSGTSDKPGAFLRLQYDDGNLVIRHGPYETPAWDAYTRGPCR